MKAIVTTGVGGPETLSWTDIEDLTCGPGELLIRTAAAGVNRADLLQTQGHYPPPSGASELLGLEVAGTVAAMGDDVEGWQVGDEAVALLAGGGYAELVAVPAGQCLPPPPGMDLATAAGIVEVAATVDSNLAGLLTDDGGTVLIHGGAGGIGTFAIQYAKQRGWFVATTAGSTAKLEHCRSLGADLALDYHDDWLAGLKAGAPHRYADVILDIIGAKYLPSNVSALAVDGTLVVIGLQGGRKGELDLAALLGKRATIRATSVRQRPAAEKAAIMAGVRERVWPLLADGSIQPGPQTRFELPDAAAAHRHLASGDNVGKIVLTVP